MFHDTQDLADLISSRICHDLISPLGAISNGMELLAMSGVHTSPELDLIAESIANANSKIRFFRVAYGRAAKDTTLPQPEISAILDDYFKGARLQLHWHPTHEVQRREVKLAFLAIQCLETTLPYGGTLDVHQDGNGWTLTARAAKLRADPALWGIFDGGAPSIEIGAPEVQFAMLSMLTQGRKPALSVAIDAVGVRMQF